MKNTMLEKARLAIVCCLFLAALNLCPDHWLRAGLAPLHSLFSVHPCTEQSARDVRRSVNAISVALGATVFAVASCLMMPIQDFEDFLSLGTCPFSGAMAQVVRTMPERRPSATAEDVTFLLRRRGGIVGGSPSARSCAGGCVSLSDEVELVDRGFPGSGRPREGAARGSRSVLAVSALDDDAATLVLSPLLVEEKEGAAAARKEDSEDKQNEFRAFVLSPCFEELKVAPPREEEEEDAGNLQESSKTSSPYVLSPLPCEELEVESQKEEEEEEEEEHEATAKADTEKEAPKKVKEIVIRLMDKRGSHHQQTKGPSEKARQTELGPEEAKKVREIALQLMDQEKKKRKFSKQNVGRSKRGRTIANRRQQ